MHSEIIVIDRVFDVHQGHWSRGGPKCTSLSLMAAGSRRANLLLDGWPNLQAPKTVTAFFRQPNDWNQLIGWVDHNTGEAVAAFPEASWLTVAIATAFVAAWLSFLMLGRWLVMASPGAQAALLLGTALLCILSGRMVWRTRRTQVERTVLEACRLSMLRTLKTGNKR